MHATFNHISHLQSLHVARNSQSIPSLLILDRGEPSMGNYLNKQTICGSLACHFLYHCDKRHPHINQTIGFLYSTGMYYYCIYIPISEIFIIDWPEYDLSVQNKPGHWSQLIGELRNGVGFVMIFDICILLHTIT